MSQARASPDLQGKARKKAELNNLTLEIRLLEGQDLCPLHCEKEPVVFDSKGMVNLIVDFERFSSASSVCGQCQWSELLQKASSVLDTERSPFLFQEELQRLETAPPASEACKLFVHSVEVQTDPFLRNSANPPHWDVRWDRWCKGPSLSRPTCCFVQALGRPHSMNPGNFTHF